MEQYQLALDENQRKALIEQFNDQLAKLDDEIAAIQSKRKSLHELLRQLNTLSKVPANQLNLADQAYDSVWTWAQKIDFVLNKVNRFMYAGDIVKYILEYEPRRSENKEASRKSIAGSLTIQSKKGELARIDGGSRGSLYGQIDWMNGNKPKVEYRLN